ncbi:MAG: HEAT repeat domain-containing protein [Planctomycetota bacterium]|nr:HEAT repeat domain-containing protein [Planctomycetota bacterium]
MDSRWSTVIAELNHLGVSQEEIDDILSLESEKEDRLQALLDRVDERHLVKEESLQELRLAVRCAEEASELFMRAHLEKKPVVLLLKGLEEILKSQHEGNGKSRSQSKTVRSAESGPVVFEERAAGHETESEAIEDTDEDDDPREKTQPVAAIEPSEERSNRKVAYIHPDTSPYEIITRLGHGRLTQTVKGREKATGDAVVLKFFPEGCSRDREFTDHLFSQVRQSISLKHPNLAGIRQITLSDKQCYAVTDYVAGETLKNMLASGNTLSPKKVIPILVQLLRGVNAAHEFGMCHGSIHPGNIMCSAVGEVKLVDVGLGEIDSEFVDVPEGPRLYQAHYRAPEREEGTAPTVASDVYELGAVMYQLLAWQPPFAGHDLDSLSRAHRKEELPPLPESVTALSDRLEPTIQKMMAKESKKRFQDVGEVLAIMETISSLHPQSDDEDIRPELRPRPPVSSLSKKRRRRQKVKDNWLPHIAIGLGIGILLLIYWASTGDPLEATPHLKPYRDNLIVKDKVDDDVASKLAREGDAGLGVIEFLLKVPKKQVQAVRALGLINTAASRELLVQQLEHQNIKVRCEAIVVLGKSQHADIFSFLEKLAEDPSPEIRRNVMIALREFGDEKALPIVKKHLGDDDISVQRQAKDTLRNLTGE